MRYINNNVFQVHILLHEIQTLKDLCKKNFFRKICQIHFEIERHFLKSRSIELHYTFFGDLCADLDPCLEGWNQAQTAKKLKCMVNISSDLFADNLA